MRFSCPLSEQQWIKGCILIASFCCTIQGSTDEIVSNTNDSGAGSLRQAISNLQTTGGNIVFSVPANSTITLLSSLPVLSPVALLNINTTNIPININGNGNSVFSAVSGTVTISNINVSGAVAKGGAGGSGIGSGGGGGLGAGAGLFVNTGSNLSLTDMAFSGNAAVGGNGGKGGFDLGGNGYGGGAGGGSCSISGGNAGAIGSGASGPAGGGGGGGGGSTPGVIGSPNSGNIGGNGGAGGGPSGGAGGIGGTNNATDGSPGGAPFSGGGGSGGLVQSQTSGQYSGGAGADFGGGGGGGAVSQGSGPNQGGNGGVGGFGGGGGGAGATVHSIGGSGGVGGFGGGGGGSTNAFESPSVYAGGAGNGGHLEGSAGGGGAALGGAIFVRSGGFLTLNYSVSGSSTPISGNTVTGGLSGDSLSSPGQAYGPDIFLNSGGTLTFNLARNITFSSPLVSDGLTLGSGGIIIQGTGGILSLTGVNSYTGITTVNAGGILNIENDLNLGAATTNLILDNGTLSLSSLFSSTRAVMIGSGGGTITANSPIAIGLFNGPMTLDGSLSISGINSVTLNGNLTGPGSLITANGASLTLSGTNSYSGGTTIGTGTTVRIAKGSNLGTGTVTLGGLLEVIAPFEDFITNPIILPPSGGTLQVDTGGTVFYNNTMTGTGNFHKTGTGILALFGANHSTGTTFIDQGEIDLFNATISNTVMVNPGASLLGSGSVGPLTNNGGTVHPIGTLTVNGDYVQQNGATFSVGILDTGTNVQVEGLMTITGDAHLAGGGLVMASPTGAIPFGKQFLVLQTTQVGGIKSLFSSVSLPLGFDLSYVNDPDQVIITAMEQMFLFSSRPHHHNPTQVFNYFEAIQNHADPALLPVVDELALMDGDDLTKALDQLHPAIFGAFDLLNTNTSSMVTSIFNRRMGRICCEQVKRNCDYEGVNIWLDPLGYWYDQERIKEQVGFHARTAGAIAGIDYRFSNGVRVGGGGGYTWSDVHWRKERGHGHMDTGYFGLFSDYTRGMVQVEAALSGSVDSLQATRHIHFTGVNYRAHHNKGGYNFTAHIGGGADIKLAEYSVKPFATVDYLYLFQKGFREHGADALNLVVQARHAQMLRSEVGISGSLSFKVGKRGCLVPTIWVSGIAENFLTQPHYRSRFVNEPGEFAVRTYNKPIYLVSPGFDVSCTLDSGLNLAVRYSAEITGQSTNQKLDGRVQWAF